MPFRRWTCLLLGLALAGCASRSVDVKPHPSDPAQFAGWRCEAMFDEMDRVQQRAADVAYAVDARHGNNVIALSVGVMVFWPALFAMRPDGPDAAELAQLKGRHDALKQAAATAGCGDPPMFLTPQQAAELPLAAGERLVYEERTSPRRPAEELGLRLTALRRGQLDFAADLDGQVLTGVWAQDHAGNLVSLPGPAAGGRGFVYWTRLLPREMALGDVMTGELLHSGGAYARVRGQVIATGVQTTFGRPFDAAVVELFGDVVGSPAAARIDGVMVVDRRSGILLRLELRSGDADFALRRTLLRIEPAG
jgi:hypothetical protein